MSEQQPGVDRVQSVVHGAAQQALEGLIQSQAVPRSEAVVLDSGDWTVLVCVCPTPPKTIPGLTLTDQAVLQVLARSRGAPLPASKLVGELGQGGRIFAEITVKRSLARLKRLGLVENSRKGQRGYFLAGTVPPLFRPSRG
jgi:hypothetical protein